MWKHIPESINILGILELGSIFWMNFISLEYFLTYKTQNMDLKALLSEKKYFLLWLGAAYSTQIFKFRDLLTFSVNTLEFFYLIFEDSWTCNLYYFFFERYDHVRYAVGIIAKGAAAALYLEHRVVSRAWSEKNWTAR